MYSEDQLLPISALQHLLFCERQCALIHIEQTWDENRLTAEGRIMHDNVHNGEDESRGNIRIARGLRLRSLRLGLTGQADVVEFHRSVICDSQSAIAPATADAWQPFPIEYKRGKPKANSCDEVQLCAQALCLEEMLACTIPAGALFYGISKRRQDVQFDEPLRKQVEATSARLHLLLQSGLTPPAVYEKKCEHCSLKQACLPEMAGHNKSVAKYLQSVIM